MNEIIIDKKSWHYRLAREFYGIHLSVTHNFCEYWKKVIFSIFMLLFLALMSLGLILTFIITIIIGIFDPYPSGLVFFIIYSVTFGFLYRAYRLDKKDNNNKNSNTNQKSKKYNIFLIKYKSWKEKNCPTVSFK